MAQPVTSVSTKGVLISLILIVLALASIVFTIDPTSGFQWISILIFFGGIIWSVISYGKQIEYNSTFGNYFVHGFKVAALVTAIMIIFVVILILVYPEFKDQSMTVYAEQMGKNPDLTPDQVEKATQFYDKMFMVFSIGGTLLLYLIIGVIASLIGSAVTKRNPRPIYEE